MTKFHIVGIGGMGMSAVARLLLARGDRVSGSDKGSWPLAQALAADGATVATAFAAENVTGAEADEYDHAFLSLEPEIAIVTNVEHDHVDVFPTHGDVKRAFRHFVAGVIRGGWLVACVDDPGAAELATNGGDDLAGRQIATYGMASEAGYRVVELVQHPDGVTFDLAGPFENPVSVSLRLAGAHNARNAAGALAAADAAGVPAIAAAKAVTTFRGTERRLEELGE